MTRRFLHALVIALLGVAASPDALAGVAVGPEVELDPGGLLPVGGSVPAVAWEGTNYFVVSGGDSVGNPLSGSLVSPSGTVLGAAIPIDTSSNVSAAAVAYGAGTFLVFMTNCRLSWVSPSGSVLGTGAIGTTSGCGSPAVSFDGTNFLVAWSAQQQLGEQYAARVSPSGSVIDSTPILVNATPTTGNQVLRVGFDGTNYQLVYTLASAGLPMSPSLRLGQLTPGGALSSGLLFANVNTPAADIACNGAGGCLVVWMNQGSNLQGRTFGLSGSTGSVLTLSHNPPPSGTVPRIVWDGSHFLVVWVSGSSLMGVRVDASEAVDPADTVIGSFPAAPGLPGMAASSSGALLAWAPSWTMAAPVPAELGLLVDDTLTAQGASFPCSLMIANEQSQVAVSNGTGYLAAWVDVLQGAVVATRLDSIGTPQDVPPLVLSSTGAEPAVAAIGSSYLVTWTEYSFDTHGDIYGALVPPSGAPGAPFVISGRHTGDQTGQESVPVAATNGSAYLVAWADDRESKNVVVGGLPYLSLQTDIYAARVTAPGAVLDSSGIQVTTGGTGNWNSVASDGTDYLVMNAPSGITLIPVSASGVVGSPSNLPDGPDAGFPLSPSLTYSGSQYLAAWAVGSYNGGFPPTTYGAILAPTGAPVAGPFGICSGAGCNDPVAVPVNGSFYAGWFQFAPGQPGQSDTYNDLYGTMIGLGGAIATPNGGLVTTTASSSNANGPAIAMRTATEGLLAYNTLGTGTEAQLYRTRARIIAFDGNLPNFPDAGAPGAGADAGGSGGVSDGGIEDATIQDAALPDANVQNAPEAGTADATVDDAGSQAADATVIPGADDAGSTTANAADSGNPSMPHSGPSAGGGSDSSGGCSAGGGGPGKPVFLILAIAALTRRRRAGTLARETPWMRATAASGERKL